MTIKTGCGVCDAPKGVRGQALYPEHCPDCHTFPCGFCSACRCHGGHHGECAALSATPPPGGYVRFTGED